MAEAAPRDTFVVRHTTPEAGRDGKAMQIGTVLSCSLSYVSGIPPSSQENSPCRCCVNPPLAGRDLKFREVEASGGDRAACTDWKTLSSQECETSEASL